jgi:tetratricopeptide (TPR) repeat protein/transcriptional regulator with XRE-family HTH domain
MAEDPPSDATRRLGVELRKLRRERGLAQRELCKSLNLASHTTIVDFESGRRIPSQDILAAYERQFGLAPGSLRRLRRNALAQRAATEARRAISAGNGMSGEPDGHRTVVPRLLPGPTAEFTGRTAELSALDRHLNTESPAPVLLSAISGMGGVGKTALAVYWGHLARHRFPDGDLYIDLRGYHPSRQPVTSLEALRLLLAALGVPAGLMPLSAEERIARFRTLMTGRRMLLLLDNACTAEQVRPLLPGSPSCIVLITSRSRLGGLVAREGVHRVVVDVLAPPEARRLLRQVIGPERADAEPGAMAAIAELCAYHPLALRIAAERVTSSRSGTLAEALAHLGDQFARLDALSTGDDETGTVRAVFTWSYDALDQERQHLFRVLGLHDGPDITLPAAAAFAGCPVDRCGQLLAGLLDAHLLEERAEGRFRLHDLLHLFARERALTDDSESDRLEAMARASSWYLHSACAARAVLDPQLPPMHPPAPAMAIRPMTFASYAAALSWCETERPNLVAVSASAARHHDLQVAWQLPTALYAYFDLRKQYSDWISTHRTAAQAARLVGDGEAEGRVLCNLGNAYRPLGQLDEAAACYSQALALFRDVGYRQGEAKVLGNLASTYDDAGRQDEAVATHEAAIALFRDLGDRHGEALSLANLGRVHGLAARYAEAVRCEHRAMELFGELGDRHGQARATSNLGAIECKLGRLESAINLLARATAEFAALGDRYEEAETLTSVADAHAARGDTADASRCLQRADDIFREIGDTRKHREIAIRLGGHQSE